MNNREDKVLEINKFKTNSRQKTDAIDFIVNGTRVYKYEMHQPSFTDLSVLLLGVYNKTINRIADIAVGFQHRAGEDLQYSIVNFYTTGKTQQHRHAYLISSYGSSDMFLPKAVVPSNENTVMQFMNNVDSSECITKEINGFIQMVMKILPNHVPHYYCVNNDGMFENRLCFANQELNSVVTIAYTPLALSRKCVNNEAMDIHQAVSSMKH